MKKTTFILLCAMITMCVSCGKSIQCRECGATMEKSDEGYTYWGLEELFECERCGYWIILVSDTEIYNRDLQDEADSLKKVAERKDELRRIRQAKLDSIDLKADSLERAYRVAKINSGLDFDFEFSKTETAKRMKIEMEDLEYEYKKAGGTYFGHYLY